MTGRSFENVKLKFIQRKLRKNWRSLNGENSVIMETHINDFTLKRRILTKCTRLFKIAIDNETNKRN